MSQQEELNQTKIQEMETAKGKLSDLIDKLKENPSLSEDEINEIAGGAAAATLHDANTNGSCPNYVC